jgi:hypothetical protein
MVATGGTLALSWTDIYSPLGTRTKKRTRPAATKRPIPDTALARSR